MDEEPIVKFGGLQDAMNNILIAAMLFAMMLYKSQKLIADKHFKDIEFLATLFFTGIVLYAIALLAKMKSCIIYADRMEFKDGLVGIAQEIYFKDIDYWTEEVVRVRTNRYSWKKQTFFFLTIYAKGEKCKLNSLNFADEASYAKAKQIITKGKPENKKEELLNQADRQNRTGWLFIAVSAVLFIWAPYTTNGNVCYGLSVAIFLYALWFLLKADSTSKSTD